MIGSCIQANFEEDQKTKLTFFNSTRSKGVLPDFEFRVSLLTEFSLIPDLNTMANYCRRMRYQMEKFS
jgi:hypothetical protein